MIGYIDMQNFTKPKTLSVKVRLRQSNYANFLEYYHEGSALNDYFYKYLAKLANDHKKLANCDVSFKSPFNEEGFYFKTKGPIKCMNAAKKLCLIDDLLDHDVTMKLKLVPYNFISDKQIIGISIQAISISC